MPRLRGRKLECFYCGCRSAQTYTQGLGEWQCKKCDAVNYLDKNGEITDPPALQTPSPTRFAVPRPRPASPEISQAEGSLFCQICLKNQHLLTQSLAEYYPSPDHPDYAKYEREYPRYRKNLEERYPQICEQCEPSVRARIQQTGYAAKTDHLRRMMEQTRGSGGRRQVWSWKSAAVAVGEAAWYSSLLGQFMWHLVNAIKATEVFDGLRDVKSPTSMSNCLGQDLQYSYITPACAEAYNSTAGFALYLGLLSVWWNPRLKEYFKPRRGRIIGMGEYYKLQVIFLAVRFAAWAVVAKTPTFDFDPQTTKGIHAFMLVFTALSIIISYRTVRVDDTPLVRFQESPESLIPQRPQASMNTAQQTAYSQGTQSSVQNSHGVSRTRPFPINNLAPTLQPSYPLIGGPLTPPLDEDDSEAMDWTPSQGSLRPASSYRSAQPKPIPVQPSPFYGKLPANPTSQNYRLRNAPNQPQPLPMSTPQPQNFFDRMFSPKNQDEYSDVGSEPSASKQATFSPQFAPPKFFPPPDHREDTGLESIFSNTFTLADEPAEVRVTRLVEQKSLHQDNSSSPSQRALTIFLLVLATLGWYRAPTLPIRFLLPIRLASLGLAAVVAGRDLFQATQKDKAFWSLSDMLVFGCELGLAIFLGSAARSPLSRPFADGSGGLEHLGLGLLLVMTVQESWIAVTEFRNASLNAPRQPATPSPARSITPPPPALPQPPSPILTTSSFSTQLAPHYQHPTTQQPTTLSTASSLPSISPSPSRTPSSSYYTRTPTDYHPSFATNASSQYTTSTTSSYAPPTPSLAPSDSYSAYPGHSTFTRSGEQRGSGLSGLGGLSLGGGGGGGGFNVGEQRRRREGF